MAQREPLFLLKHLSLRALFIGLSGSVIITASSMYVALRMGALPWPTLFVAVLSLSVLGRMRGSSLQEINVTHTIMSSGAMVAGGLAFTMPGLWMLYPEAVISPFSLIVLTVSGAVLGVLFTLFHRRSYIEREELPFPMGTAAYNTLKVGDAGGAKAIWLFVSMGISAVFTLLRDGIQLIPAALSVKVPGKHSPSLHTWLSPMAMGIGFIIGPMYTGIWALGALLGYYLIIAGGLGWELFADLRSADLFRSSLGIGLMVGTGLGIILKALLGLLRKRGSGFRFKLTSEVRRAILLAAIVWVALLLFTPISAIQALLAILGIWAATAMASLLTGQTAINPMEILGILVILAVALVTNPSPVASFMIAGVTAVACGLTGDVMNDFKAGKHLGTHLPSQIIAEAVGSILGALIAVLVLLGMKQAFGGFGTPELPAPQAAAVAQMIGGIAQIRAFSIGMALGALLYLLRLPSTTLGLGVYLPLSISSIVFAGGVLRVITNSIDRKKSSETYAETGSLIASGFLGGEGIVGVLIALLSIF